MPKKTAAIRVSILVLAMSLIGLSGTAFAQPVAGLIAMPSSLDFAVPLGAQGTVSVFFFVTFNGSPVGSITGVSVASGQPWLQGVQLGSASLVVDLNPSTLSAGMYTGSITISTVFGIISLPVTLEYGVPAPLQCFANGGVATLARAEGLSELIGDLVVNCIGGTPTPAGSPVPTVDIQISLNTSLTSRLLANPWSEALLLIDEPTPQTQQLCGAQSTPETSQGVCAITGTGTGSGVYNGTSGRPNVFQGRQTASNSVTWSAVPIDPPGRNDLSVSGQPARAIRITNIRANANALGVAPPNATPTAIVESISPFPAFLLPISFPSQTVAYLQQGAFASLSGAQSFSQCSSQNLALADDSTQSGTAQFNVSFAESFATVFKRRNTATSAITPNALANQNNLTFADHGVYNTETGFYNNSFPAISGRGNLALAGLADQGTRLLVNFQNIPAGVSLFTQVAPPVSETSGGDGTPDVFRLTYTDLAGGGPFSPVVGNSSGIAPIPLTGGSGVAVFESLQSDPNTFATVNVPIYVAYDATSGLPTLGSGTVSAALAPFSLVTNSDASSPLPRFAFTAPAGQTAFTINPCSCASNMSAPITVTRGGFFFNFGTGHFQQNVTIKNTGNNSIAGPISMALDNLSGNAALANAAGVTSCAAPSGSPYIAVNAGSALAPGASASVVLQFTHTGSAGITYNTRMLGGSGGR
jgi:hypothetical protein